MNLFEKILIAALCGIPLCITVWNSIKSTFKRWKRSRKLSKEYNKLFIFFNHIKPNTPFYLISELDLLDGYPHTKVVKKRKLREFEYRENYVEKYKLTFMTLDGVTPTIKPGFDITYFATMRPKLIYDGKVVRLLTSSHYMIYITKDEAMVKKILDALYHRLLDKLHPTSNGNKHLAIVYKNTMRNIIRKKDYNL